MPAWLSPHRSADPTLVPDTRADVETLRRGYEALNDGDVGAVLELLDPDIQWHEPTPSPEAGTHVGRDSFEQFLRVWLDAFEDFHLEAEHIVEHEGKLVVVVRQTGRGRSSGVQVDVRLAHVWTVEEGRAVRWEGSPVPSWAP
jgi:ketosteroid isomerase-like protein